MLMPLKTFISKLNWRQVLIHLIGTWFFMHAFQTLSYLYNTDLIIVIRQPTEELQMKSLRESGTTLPELIDFTRVVNISNSIGLLAAFIVSLTISLKRHWFWFNSFLVFVITYLLNWFDLPGWSFLKNIFLTPGEIFRNTTLEFLSNGIILLVPGLLCFFLKPVNKFITGGVHTK
jgi:hypothetical protein